MDTSPFDTGLRRAEVIAARPIPPAPTPRSPQPLDLATVPRRNAPLDLVLLLVVALVVPFGFELTAQLTLGDSTDVTFDPGIITLHKWFDALLLVVLATYFIQRNRLSPAAFGLRTNALARQGLWGFTSLVAAYAAFLPAMIVILVLVSMYPGLEQDLLHRARFIQALPLNDLTAILLLLVPVAIHEELLFRALLIPYLHRVGCRWPVAVLLSALIKILLLNGHPMTVIGVAQAK